MRRFKRPRDPAAHFSEGMAAYARGDYPAAVKAFERATDLDPSVPEAYFQLGMAYSRMGSESAAAAAFELALMLLESQDKDGSGLSEGRARLRVDTLYNSAHSAEKLRDWHTARVRYEEAIDFQPDHSKAWCNRGNVLLKLGEFELAAESHTKAIAANPSDFRAHWGRAIAHSQLGRDEDLVADLREFLRLAPDGNENIERARRALASALGRLGEPGEGFGPHAGEWATRRGARHPRLRLVDVPRYGRRAGIARQARLPAPPKALRAARCDVG